MERLYKQKAPEATEQLYCLACGIDPRVVRYTRCIVSGIKLHNNECEKHRIGEHNLKEIEFYDVLMDIVVLQYLGKNEVYLFKCNWWDVGNKKSWDTFR